MSVFLPVSLVRSTNKFVTEQSSERNPRFPRKDFAGALAIAGGILRYSTATPIETVTTAIPGGYRVETMIGAPKA